MHQAGNQDPSGTLENPTNRTSPSPSKQQSRDGSCGPLRWRNVVLWCLVGVGRVVVHGILRGAAAGANSFAVAEILTGTSGTRGARYPSTASWASCLRAELVGVRRRRITTNSP